jgi:hypothetical protein|tara:strand:- start:58 stop:435 length:378 start_codon:yes stop_codon:yes gene_type:complete
MLKYIIDAFNGLLITSNIQQDTFIGNNTNVNGGLEQYDILLKRYKKLYQLELEQLLEYKDITVKVFIQPLTMTLSFNNPTSNDKVKKIISEFLNIKPSQVIIIINNSITSSAGGGTVEFTIIQTF